MRNLHKTEKNNGATEKPTSEINFDTTKQKTRK